MMIPAICMMLSMGASATEADISVRDANSFGAASTSINDIGTFHDNSWDGVPLKKISTGKNDSKKNLVHHYKVVNGKVKDLVTGKVVKGLKVCKDNPQYFVGDNTTRIVLSNNWDETIEAIINYDENKLGGNYPVFNTYIPSWIEPSPNASFNLEFNKRTCTCNRLY